MEMLPAAALGIIFAFNTRTPEGQKMIKYTLVSVISVTVYEIGLGILYGLLHWDARAANILACSVATVPS